MDLPFGVNALSGEIFVSGQLDRETVPKYSLELVATDSSPFKPLSSSATVIIRLTDVNDNSPFFFNGEIGDDEDGLEEDKRDFFLSPDTKSGDFILGKVYLFIDTEKF